MQCWHYVWNNLQMFKQCSGPWGRSVRFLSPTFLSFALKLRFLWMKLWRQLTEILSQLGNQNLDAQLEISFIVPFCSWHILRGYSPNHIWRIGINFQIFSWQVEAAPTKAEVTRSQAKYFIFCVSWSAPEIFAMAWRPFLCNNRHFTAGEVKNNVFYKRVSDGS